MAIEQSKQNVCAVLHGPKDLRIEQRPLEPPSEDQVQIRIKCTTICGSDQHYYVHGRNGDFALQHPMCLGHESAGIITAVGANVTDRAIGDRVALEVGLYCKNCARCKEGRYNLCPSMRFASSAKTAPHLDGTLQTYMNWPAWAVHSLPAHVTLEAGALVEPLSVVLQGFRRSQFKAGQSCLILGAGAVGLLACAAAKASGASYVAAVDIDAGRLAFAKKNGWADGTYLLPRSSPTPASQTEQETDPRARRAKDDAAMIGSSRTSAATILETLFPDAKLPLRDGFDCTLECSGVPSCVQMGIFATRPGGKVVLIGMGSPIQTLPLGAASLREVDILGVFRYANCYQAAIAMLADGSLRASGGGVRADGQQQNDEDSASISMAGGIENLISHRFPLSDANEAFETMCRGRGQEGRGVTKILIVDE